MFNGVNKKLIGFAILAGAIFFSILGGVFYGGYKIGQGISKPVIIEGAKNLEAGNNFAADFSVFWEAWKTLKEQHIKGESVKNQDFLYGAISGLANSFGDPNTIFLPPEDSKKFEEDVTGNFGGIGAEIGIRNNELIVVAPLEGSPAEKAGLKSGDKIFEINGENSINFGVNEAVKKIRGEIGTKVTLTILRDNEENSRKIIIIRANIEVPTLKFNVLDDNIGHIQLFAFNENAPFLFYKAALTALLGNAQGLVLDLRNDPGGFLEVANNLAGWFLEKGQIIAKEKFRDGKELIFRSEGNAALKNVPIVILMNNGSASASEILAGALRDNNNVKIIGEKSFGKGTVQELFSLKDNSKLKITIANWLTPKGNLIDHNGLEPDFKVEFTEKDIESKNDVQLSKALEVLKEEIKSKS